STGQVCFCWYRIKVTLPDEADGKKVIFVTTVDDYGEVWVDGKLPRTPGQTGGPIVAGFNVPNRVELKDAKAGKTYQIAVFGINGPISAAPGNFIFLGDTFLEIAEKQQALGGASPDRRTRWTIARLMAAVLAAATALGLLRSSEGRLFALLAGAVVGCYLAPVFAHRGMRKLDRELAVRLAGL